MQKEPPPKKCIMVLLEISLKCLFVCKRRGRDHYLLFSQSKKPSIVYHSRTMLWITIQG